MMIKIMRVIMVMSDDEEEEEGGGRMRRERRRMTIMTMMIMDIGHKLEDLSETFPWIRASNDR
jgi:hypothetical protein